MAASEALERNLRLYAWHQLTAGTLFWGPIFFFYFSERFPVEQVLQLASIYYLSVVLLEVPSGYFSDRISRVATLRISNAAMGLAYVLFVFGGDRFALFVAAEMTLALGYAFRSGTDTSFHFDTLSALGRERDFGEREAWIQRNAYLAVAGSAVVGGLVSLADLRLAYVVQVVFTVGALVIACKLLDQPRHEQGYAEASFGKQLRECATYATQPFLAWVFAYMILMTTTEHIPWQFAQPYVAAVFTESIQDVDRSPMVTGVLHAVIAFVGAMAAGWSIRIRDRIGVGGTLLTVTAVQTGLIVAMAVWVHPLIAVLLVLRSVQPAVSRVVVAAAIVPRVPQAQRATYQSLHSFTGRLGFSLVLYWLSQLGDPGAVADPETIGRMLSASAWLTVAAVFALVVMSRFVRSDQAKSESRTG